MHFRAFPGIPPVTLQFPHQQSFPEFVQHQHHHHHQSEREPHFRHNEQLITGHPASNHRNSREFFGTIRDMFDDTNSQSYDYITPAPEPLTAPDQFSYVPPEHQAYHQPSYFSTYQQYHTYQQQPQPQFQPQPQPQQQPPPPPLPYATPSCGSSLLFSCQPQVQPVSCHESSPPSPYVWPTSAPPPPPPSPAAPLYIPPASYSYGNRGPNSAARPNAVPMDLFMSPGPPYMSEPNLGSTLVRTNASPANSKVPSLSHGQRADSRTASSNGEKKTEGHTTTEMSIVQTTPAATTAAVTTELDNVTPTLPPTSSPPPPPPSPLTDEQIEKFADKLNSHVESLEKFREMARKKLREAMARSNASDEELSAFFDPQAFEKRKIQNQSSQSNPQLTNSVW